MQLLEEHFQILDTNNYVAKLQATHMTADQVDIQKIQLYAQNFMKSTTILPTQIPLSEEAQQKI